MPWLRRLTIRIDGMPALLRTTNLMIIGMAVGVATDNVEFGIAIGAGLAVGLVVVPEALNSQKRR